MDTGRAITKLDSVYTGVQDVDLIIPVLSTDDKDTDDGRTNGDGEAFFSDNIFVLYDEDKYIIGAIVLNVKSSGTDDYVYVLGDADEEWIEDGDYFWSFQGITPDGQIDTYTVREDYDGVFTTANKIDDAITDDHGAMFLVTFDADGYITDAEECEDADSFVYGKTEFLKEIDIDPDTYDVYDVAHSQAAALYRVGRTLYIDKEYDVGLTTTSGCTFVVIQEEQDSKGGNSEWTYESYSTMQQALDALANADAFKGNITALLNDKGTAEYVVLNSTTPVTIGTEGDHGNTSGDYTVSLKTALDGKGLTLTINATSVETPNEVAEYTLYSENLVTGDERVEARGDVTVDATTVYAKVADTSSNLLRYYVVVEVEGDTLTTNTVIGG